MSTRGKRRIGANTMGDGVHLPGVEAGRRVAVYRIDSANGERPAGAEYSADFLRRVLTEMLESLPQPD